MLAPMRRVLALFGLALVVPIACEDRTVPLTQDQQLSVSNSGGIGGGTSSSTTWGSTSGTQTASGGSGNFGTTGFSTHGVTSTTVPHPFGAGGDNDSDAGGASNHSNDSNGSGGLPPVGGISTSGGNEGGQGPDCQDDDCLTCAYARGYCNVPTLDCSEQDDWLRNCDACGPQCPVGLTCFQGFKCRASCFGEGGCGPGEYCDPEFSACVACYDDEHCADFGKVCLAGECVECRTKDDCSNPDRPFCIAGACRECISPANCNGGFCNALNRCIECFDDEHCNDEQPFCNAGVCTECRGNEDCEDHEYCSSFNFTCSPRD